MSLAAVGKPFCTSVLIILDLFDPLKLLTHKPILLMLGTAYVLDNFGLICSTNTL